MNNGVSPNDLPPSHEADLEREIAEALGDRSVEQIMEEATQAPPAETEARAAPGSREGGPPHFEHEMRRGRISAIQGDDVFVELSGVDGKLQGIVPLTQFERPPRTGSIMDFVVERIDEAEGVVVLSREGAISRATWENLQRGAITEARVVSTNKGGLELEMIGGIRAFMPASQVDLHHVADLNQFLGQKLAAMVQEIDRKSKKVLLSRRHFLEQEREAKRKKLMEDLEPGQVCAGKVSSLMDYGAFVDLGGVDGLVHVSDMSYTHVNKPSDVLSVGQQVHVKVLKIDPEKGRISLGLKQVAPDPWEGIENRYTPGEAVSGRVVRVADFGAFIEVEAGVEGLLPVSEMSWKRAVRPADTVKVGDVIRLAVLQVDPAKRRIALSLKQVGGDPWTGAERMWPRNNLVEATVQSITDFGAFVEIVPGVEGLVHISELSDRRVNSVQDVLKIGETRQFRVLEVDEENRKIRLSLKQVEKPAAEAAPARDQRDQRGAPQPARAMRKSNKNLKGGMDVGGGGLGGIGRGLGDLRL